MGIKEVYKKFKHLDKLLSDERLTSGDGGFDAVCYDLWQAIKNEIRAEEFKKNYDARN